MPKNKRQKYERVRHLPNVTVSEIGESRPPCIHLWYDPDLESMEIVLELGCGKGEHSLAFAAADPGRLYVGVDRKSHRLCVGAERALADGLKNVHFLRARVEDIQAFFVDRAIHEIWLTFPDPLPKQRTSKSRLSAAPFLDMYARLLVPGGTVHLKTDSDLLFTFTQDAVERWGGRVVFASGDIHAAGDGSLGAGEVASAYEHAARARGMAIRYMAFQLS
ncbi:MAG: tRNA (guanosine(46)-N7)-methyltransferase TrmB [Desulfosarcina sp.]